MIVRVLIGLFAITAFGMTACDGEQATEPQTQEQGAAESGMEQLEETVSDAQSGLDEMTEEAGDYIGEAASDVEESLRDLTTSEEAAGDGEAASDEMPAQEVMPSEGEPQGEGDAADESGAGESTTEQGMSMDDAPGAEGGEDASVTDETAAATATEDQGGTPSVADMARDAADDVTNAIEETAAAAGQQVEEMMGGTAAESTTQELPARAEDRMPAGQ